MLREGSATKSSTYLAASQLNPTIYYTVPHMMKNELYRKLSDNDHQGLIENILLEWENLVLDQNWRNDTICVLFYCNYTLRTLVIPTLFG